VERLDCLEDFFLRFEHLTFVCFRGSSWDGESVEGKEEVEGREEVERREGVVEVGQVMV